MSKTLEIWDEAINVEFPPRSRYHALVPVGLGTGMVESLTSHITRVARSHFLPPWVLVTRDLATHFQTVKGTCNGHCDLFANSAVSLNGECETAREGVRIMESLTLRRGLDELTMTALSGIISPAALLHLHEHWCPQCLNEWRKHGSVVYAPLLWQIRAVVMCPHHLCALQYHCPHCGRSHLPLARHGNPGHCPWCQTWLGAMPAKQLNEPHRGLDPLFAQFMAKQVLDLIADRSRFAASVAGSFAANAAWLFERFGGSLSGFARELHHHPKSVRFWIDKRQLPRVYAVLVVAYRYGVKAVDLLSGSLHASSQLDGQTLSTETTAKLKPRLHRHNQEFLRLRLEEALKRQTYPPQSVASLARELGCHCSYLQRKFPDVTSQISHRFRQYWSISKQQRLFFAELITKSRTSEIAARGEYPSISKVKRTLLKGMSFRMPIVKEAWRETLREWGFRSPSIRRDNA